MSSSLNVTKPRDSMLTFFRQISSRHRASFPDYDKKAGKNPQSTKIVVVAPFHRIVIAGLLKIQSVTLQKKLFKFLRNVRTFFSTRI